MYSLIEFHLHVHLVAEAHITGQHKKKETLYPLEIFRLDTGASTVCTSTRSQRKFSCPVLLACKKDIYKTKWLYVKTIFEIKRISLC